MLLYFAYADFEEGRHKYEKVHQIYSKFLDIPDIEPTLVCVIKDIFGKEVLRHGDSYKFLQSSGKIILNKILLMPQCNINFKGLFFVLNLFDSKDPL